MPLFSWSIVVALIMQHNGWIKDQSIFEMILQISAKTIAIPYWFMYYIIGMYLISPFIKTMTKKMSPNMWRYLIFLWGINVALKSLQVLLPVAYQKYAHILFLERIDFMYGELGFFIIGLYLANESQNKYSNKIIVPMICSLLAVITYGTYYLTSYNEVYTEHFQMHNGFFMSALAICVFIFAKQNLNYKNFLTPIVTLISQLGFGIYLSHAAVLTYLKEPAIKSIDILVRFFTVSIVCIIISIIMASIPIVCEIFLGMSFKKACNTCNLQFLINKFKSNIISKEKK